jgi:hypothetical protein
MQDPRRPDPVAVLMPQARRYVEAWPGPLDEIPRPDDLYLAVAVIEVIRERRAA